MEAVDRIINYHDWLTFIILGILLIIFILNFLDQERLHQLVSLPYNSLYFSNYEAESNSLFKGFNLLLFVSSNLILSVFLYLVFQNLFPQQFKSLKHPYLTVLTTLLVYWGFKILSEYILSWLFDLSEMHKKMLYTKMSYFYSINFYLLFLLLFGVYYFNWQGNYTIVVLVIFSILLIIRYYKFIILSQRSGVFSLFYFILYLCTLEIAPLLLAFKWNMTR